MVAQRKRFRIEELHSGLQGIEDEAMAFMPGDSAPALREIMQELKELRADMGKIGSGGIDQALLSTYKAQIEQCEKLKSELDLIQGAIDKTKQEIATLHDKSFNGTDMLKATCELGAVVGGTEQATQQILEAAEEIDQAAAALAKGQTPAQQTALCQEIQERVIQIFEASNFQDLTGQRITKVINTMRFIEQHIKVMIDIWGGAEEIKQHAPIKAPIECDSRLLNGPKLDDDEGHASQDDIDALFN